MTPQVHTITVIAPTDYGTSPAAIWEGQKRDVRAALRLGMTEPADISDHCILPVWTVLRALYEIETGERWTWREARKRQERKKGQPRVMFGEMMAS